MAGGMDHACEKWVIGAAGSKSSVFAFALAGAAVAAAL